MGLPLVSDPRVVDGALGDNLYVHQVMDRRLDEVYQNLSDSFRLFLRDFEHYIDNHYYPLQSAVNKFFDDHDLSQERLPCSCHINAHGFRPFNQYTFGLARLRLVPESSPGSGSTSTSSGPPTPLSEDIPYLESFRITDDRGLTTSPVQTEVSSSSEGSEDSYETPEDLEGSGGVVWGGEGGQGVGAGVLGARGSSY